MPHWCSTEFFAASCAANQVAIQTHRTGVKAALLAALAAAREPALDED